MNDLGKLSKKIRKTVRNFDKKVKQIEHLPIDEKQRDEIKHICKSLNLTFQQIDNHMKEETEKLRNTVRENRTDNERPLKEMEDNFGKLHGEMRNPVTEGRADNEESPFWMLLMGIGLVVFLVFTHVNASHSQR